MQRGDEFESGTKGGAGDDGDGDVLLVVMVSVIVAAIAVFALLIAITATLFYYATVIMFHFYDACPRLQTPCCRLWTLLQAASSHASNQHFCKRRRHFRAMHCEFAAVFKRNKEQVAKIFFVIVDVCMGVLLLHSANCNTANAMT